MYQTLINTMNQDHKDIDLYYELALRNFIGNSNLVDKIIKNINHLTINDGEKVYSKTSIITYLKTFK